MNYIRMIYIFYHHNRVSKIIIVSSPFFCEILFILTHCGLWLPESPKKSQEPGNKKQKRKAEKTSKSKKEKRKQRRENKK